ncbi:recombinase family protein [Ketogulonicigenium vulgare]|uniref:Resolvase domain protein n=1 Tax=Ketogulonicigenium vulgare (strain WSH-001) TaxID=759362 RepID=F9Y963_KETVW|nr:recombinase family protein [Ketogulonicigenium vulgare]ADO43101.1 putative DNA recombinase [Ketogulonicigenium vulgare Y25]AEM41280.1 Resolvase domain protein [Ketogulonicigenium vulgare WSH-001]AOZ55014.1 DNA recombinase [Ketogulonicigenium vulgare]
MTMRVAIYARYSSDLQNAASIEDQIRLCRERATREGWQIVGSYEDAGLSGSNMILRPGIQRLLQDGRAHRFDIVLSEALDRLSRNQADIATIYQNLSFAGVDILTLADGRVNEMHIGLKGTMNALFLKDLAAKTHRGLRGRVEAGKSGGGNAYGYRVLRHLTEDGEIKRGDREINEDEAAVVRRIFTAYAEGMSPNRIADQFNREGVPGPRGGKWDKSTIHGNSKRGTGILNNEIYIGRLVWNRQQFVPDPVSGKRQARPNPESAWIITDVSELRIIEQDLWDQVKSRQEGRKIEQTDREAWERRKPRFLLSGLVKCGGCGGGFSTIGKDRFGCSNSRNKGTSVCTNRTGISRQELEGRILTALSDRLMDPDLLKVFAEEYIAERNHLAARHTDDRAVKEKELAKVVKDQDALVNALLSGLPPERIKAKMEQLEIRQKQLERDLAAAPARNAAVRIHPKMADTYHDRIRGLIAGLTDPDQESEAREAIRSLIDKIVAMPVPTKGKRMSLDLTLHGDLAGILALSLGADLMSGQQKTVCEQTVTESIEFLVAGAGFEPAAFRL